MMDVVFGWFTDLFYVTMTGLSTDASFREGFFTAIFWGGVLLAGFLFFNIALKPLFDMIVQFFRPTTPVVTLRAGQVPSGFSKLMQLMGAVLVIALLVYAIFQVATT